MLTSNFSGNFGNSMVQYVMTRMVADYNGYDFGFNPHFNFDYHNGYNQLDFLDLDYGTQHNASYFESPEGITNVWEEKSEHRVFENGDKITFYGYQEDIWDVPDGTKLVIPCCQNVAYFLPYEDKIVEWLRIKGDKVLEYQEFLSDNNVVLDEDTCVINVRGGAEYKSIPTVLLRQKYWDDAVSNMLDKNPEMNFIMVSDDPPYASSLFNDKYPVFHHSIGCDYYILNNAKNLIISNSSFAIIPVWINQNDPYVIAPEFWAGHNNSQGWVSSDMWTFGWNFMNRDGEIE